ncbi:hypothetical protein SK128_024961, partial [Halocaridina rubra]
SPPTDGWNGSCRTHKAVASRHRPQTPTVVPSKSSNLPSKLLKSRDLTMKHTTEMECSNDRFIS